MKQSILRLATGWTKRDGSFYECCEDGGDQHPGNRMKPGRPRKRWFDDVTKNLEVFWIRGWRRRALDRKE
jgi:hypothetical protein